MPKPMPPPLPPPPPELEVDMESVDPSGAVVTMLPPPPDEKAAPLPGSTAPTAWPDIGEKPPTVMAEAKGAVGWMKPPPEPGTKAPEMSALGVVVVAAAAPARLAEGATKPPTTAGVDTAPASATPVGGKAGPAMMSGVVGVAARAASAATVKPERRGGKVEG